MTTLDRKRAEDCIAKMKEFGTYRGHKIGRVRQDFPEAFPTYHKGEFVIVRSQGDGKFIVEVPLSLDSIDTEKHGFITTICTMLNVPARCIKEL